MYGKVIFWLLFVLLLLISLKFYTKYLEQKLVFIPDKVLDIEPSMINAAWEDIYFETRDGLAINGWFCPAESDNLTILFFHGNAGNIKDRVWFLNSLIRHNISVFIIDYRGYGKSEGKPSEDGIYIDAKAAYDYLTSKRDIPGDKIVLWGTSLGGAPATYLASKVKCKAVILFASFTNASDMASIIMPFFPIKFFMNVGYDNLSRLELIDVPVFVIHSKRDNIAPYWMAQKLFNTAREPKKFLSLSHSDHAIISEEDSEVFWDKITDFIRKDQKEYSSGS